MRGFVINLGINDLNRTLAQFRSYDEQTQEKLRACVQKSTSNIMLGAKRRVRIHSGNLVKGIAMTYNTSKNTGTVRAKSPHAHLVEFGARAVHEVPDRAKALKVPGGSGFAASANIPARAAKPFLRPAFEEEKGNLIQSVTEAVRK